MTGHRFNVWFARIGSALVTLGALLGSSVHLALMAQAHGVDPFWGPPLALDAMALVAGAVRRVRRDDRLALALLAGPVALSTALQVSDHWQAHPGDLIGAAMAGAPPLAAWGVFELFLRAVDVVTESAATAPSAPALGAVAVTPPVAVSAPPGDAPEHAQGATVEADPVAVTVTPEEPPAVAPGDATEHAPRARPAPRSKAAPPSLPTLVARAERLAKKLDVRPAQLSQRTLRTELHIGTRRAKELHELLARPHLVAVDGAAPG